MTNITLVTDVNYCSPWSATVWFSLNEKALRFEVHTLDLDHGEQRTGEHVQRTSIATVPAFRHGELWLSESLAIVEYLEEAFPPPSHRALFPGDMHARARDRQFLSHLRSDYLELRRCMPFEGVLMAFPLRRNGELLPQEPELTALARTQADKFLAFAQRRLPAVNVEAPTIADFELALTMRRFMRYRYELSRHGGLVAASEAIWRRASMQSWIHHARRH